MTQKTFKFSTIKSVTYRKDYMPLSHLSVVDELKESLIKKGFLIIRVEVTPTVTLNAICSKANVSLSKRKEYQKQIDEKNFSEHASVINIPMK